MKFSNNQFVVLALAAVMLAGCKDQAKQPATATSFTVDKIDATSAQGKMTDSFCFPKHRTFSFKACFKDKTLGTPLSGLEFSVIDEVGARKVARSNNDGCIVWDESHTFNFLEQVASFQLKRKFQATEIHNGTIEVNLGVNPWDGQVDDLAYTQPQNLVIPRGQVGFSSTLIGSGTLARITADQVDLKQDAIDYNNWEVDRYLNIKVAQKYNVSFLAKVLRKGADGNLIEETPKCGSINLKLDIYRTGNESLGLNISELQDKKIEVVAQVEKQLTIKPDGRVSDFIDTKFASDVVAEAASMKLLSFVRLAPADSSQMAATWSYGMAGPQPEVSTLQLKPSIDPFAGELQQQSEFPLESKMKAEKAAQQAKVEAEKSMTAEEKKKQKALALIEAAKSSPINAFAQTYKFGILNARDVVIETGSWLGPKEQKVTANEIEELVTLGSKAKSAAIIGRLLCQKMFSIHDGRAISAKEKRERLQAIENCQLHPTHKLQFVKRKFVDEVLPDKPRQTGVVNTTTFVVEKTYGMSTTDSTSSGWKKWLKGSVEANADAKFNLGWGNSDSGNGPKEGWGHEPKGPFVLKFSGGFSGGAGAEWFYGRTVTTEEKTATSVLGTSTSNVVVDSVSLAIRAKVRECVIALPKKSIPLAFRLLEGTGVVVCKNALADEWITEPYYFVNPARGQNTLINNGHTLGSGFRQVVRGEQLYAAVRRMLQDKNVVLEVESMDRLQNVLNDQTIHPLAREVFYKNKTNQEFPGMVSNLRN